MCLSLNTAKDVQSGNHYEFGLYLTDLPVVTRAPEVNGYSFVSDKFTQLIIHRWDPGKGDIGDGPIESYVIKACQRK